MKKIYLAILAAALMSTGCSNAYRNMQTPDDVYYSPGQPRPSAANAIRSSGSGSPGANQQQYAASSNSGDYVTYNDGTGSYYSGQAAERFNMFDNPASFYSYNYYFSNPWAYSYLNPYGSSMWDLGGYYSPFSSFYPSYSFSFGYGFPLTSYWDNPFLYGYPGMGYGYGGYYPGYYDPYYSSGFYGKYSTYYPNPRPSTSWGPRRSYNSQAAMESTGGAYLPSGSSGTAPRRVFNSSGVGNPAAPSYRTYAPGRIFNLRRRERTVSFPNARTGNQRSYRSVRVFDRSNMIDYRQRNFNYDNNTFQNQQPQFQPRTFQSSPSYQDNSGGYNSGSSSQAPVRTFHAGGR